MKTIDAYQYFNIPHPVTEYTGSWRLLLTAYWMALEKLKVLVLDKWS